MSDLSVINEGSAECGSINVASTKNRLNVQCSWMSVNVQGRIICLWSIIWPELLSGFIRIWWSETLAIYKSNKIELISCNHGDAARLVATAWTAAIATLHQKFEKVIKKCYKNTFLTILSPQKVIGGFPIRFWIKLNYFGSIGSLGV